MTSDPADSPPAAPMLKGHDAFTLWFDHGEDRGVALTLHALLEQVCEEVLRAAFRRDTVIANEFFRPTGPMANYGTKIRMIYMLGFIENGPYRDLITLGKIRNKFAHSIEIKQFDQDPIKSWIESMEVYKDLCSLRDDEVPSDAEDFRFRTALKFTIGEQLKLRDGFYRESVRIYWGKLQLVVHEVTKFRCWLNDRREEAGVQPLP